MKRFFLYIIMFLLVQPALATSIVILITPHYILMGADSKRMIIDDASNKTINESVCKIRNVGTYCYALAGFVASRSTFFSADSIVYNQLKSTKNFTASVIAIKREMKNALRKELQFQRKHMPQSFKKMIASKEHILEIAILSVQNNVPHVQIIGFQLTNEEKIIVKDYAASCPGDCPDQQTQFYFLGEYSEMEKFLDSRTKSSDHVSLIEQLITVQSNETPSSVGAPINMVRFTTGGMEWLK